MDKKSKKNEITKYLQLAAAVAIVVAIVILINHVIKPMLKYSDATGAMDQGEYAKAIKLFDELGNYKESKSLAKQARMLYAYEHGESIGEDDEEKIDDGDKENSYLRAKSYISNDKYDKAASILRLLGDYKDSKALLEPIKYYGLSVGDSITFGSYTQDENGKAPLEWLVVSVDEENMILLTKKVIDFMPFDESGSGAWSTSSLRTFLNGDFYNDAFSAEEKAAIGSHTSVSEDNPEYESSAGKDSTDKVFLLNIQEYSSMMAKAGGRQPAKATAYALKKGCHEYTKEKNKTKIVGSWFWLRSTGFTGSYNAICYSDGEISYGGQLSGISLGVRPAISIKLGAVNK